MEENTSSKVETFVSSAVSRILNLVMILVTIALAGIVVFFWNKNQLLEQKTKTLQEQNDNFTEMNDQVKSGDIEVKEEMGANKEVGKNISEWRTYKSDKYKFEIKYPNNWGVETFKTYSQFPGLEPIDCNQTPEKCKFEMIRFSNNKIGKENHFFSVRENYDAKKDHDSVIKNSILMEDMMDGCLITYSISSKNKGFLIHTFFSGEFIKSEVEKEQFKEKCKTNKLVGDIDVVVGTLKVY